MIVWGGYSGSYLNTGGRYNPSTDSWVATSTTNAPLGRYAHTAIWTGSEMIVWGGYSGSYFYSCGRHNHGRDTSTGTGTRNAPAARYRPTPCSAGSQRNFCCGNHGA